MTLTRIRPAGRLAAGAGLFLLAVVAYVALVLKYPQYYWGQSDATVYRDAGLAVLHHPAGLYSLVFGEPKDPFLYPPFAALLFAVPALASFAVWQVCLAVVTIGLLPVVAYAALGMAGRPAGLTRAGAAFAIGGIALGLEPVAMTLFFGQINVVLLALVVIDLALPDRFRGKGIMTGLAAAIKLTPLIFILYLLFSRRIRAAVVAIATFAVTIIIGFAVLPHASRVYWGGQFMASEVNPWHLLNQSLNGALLRLDHGGSGAHPVWLAVAAVVGIAGLAVAVAASRRGHELLGVVSAVVTMLVVSPISYSHDYVVVVPALALALCGPRRLAYRIAGPAVLIGLFGWWPIPIGPTGGFDPSVQLLPRGLLRLAPNRGSNLEFTWRGFELIFGNYYLVTGLVFLAAAGCVLLVTRRSAAGDLAAASTAKLSATSSPQTAQ